MEVHADSKAVLIKAKARKLGLVTRQQSSALNAQKKYKSPPAQSCPLKKAINMNSALSNRLRRNNSLLKGKPIECGSLGHAHRWAVRFVAVAIGFAKLEGAFEGNSGETNPTQPTQVLFNFRSELSISAFRLRCAFLV